ncbi:MAG TPA: hypothetical protein VFF78_04015, partial [Anaerolineaceae bacterium]|nr:hypothetical protein [Anaerolineaceae bacterium]
QTHNFVVGHEPAFPLPDMDNGRLRHETDSLNAHPENRDRFWTLLAAYDAIYLCGHTHNTSVERIQGVWQIDAGHARGLGDTGAASTYVQIHIQNNFITYDIYRDDAAGGAYTRMHSGVLKGLKVYLPVIQK